MPDIALSGCGTRPLIGYLKSLGVLRILARQIDPSARARWSGTAFELRTTLSQDELEHFLYISFKPSPILSPWNGGSGFYAHGNTTAVKALAAVEHSEGERFEPYRSLIGQTRRILEGLSISDKPGEAEKEALVRTLRAQWPDAAIEWLDAAIVIAGDSPAYPPLLGSGGNEGRYDFSSNYLQAVVGAFKSNRARDLLEASLRGSGAPLERMALGHLQSDASPTSSPTGSSPSLGNPWDLVLAVEGSLALVGGAARRHADEAKGILTAPFTVRSTAAGYGGAVAGEKGRAELWLPLWAGWATSAELDNLIRESRAQVRSGSGRLRNATSGLDFARAAGELGIARGIGAFERYAILERSGQANLAVPAGRIEVAPKPSAEALASLDQWLRRLLQFERADNCPTGIAREIRGLERACFQMATRGRPREVMTVLKCMGSVEGALARSGTAMDSGLAPLHSTPAEPWIEAADDGESVEFAIAVSIASLDTDNKAVPAIRDYLHGTKRHEKSGHRHEFDRARRHVVTGRSPSGLLAAIHARSHLESARAAGSAGSNPSRLGFERGRWCDVRLTRMLATRALNPAHVLQLVGGLALLDHRFAKGRLRRRGDLPPASGPAYDLLALAWWWRPSQHPSEDQADLGPRPGWAARLAAGATDHVLHDAALRLRMAGMAPIASAGDLLAGKPKGELLAAALLTPLSDKDLAHLKKTVTMPTKDEDER